MLAAKSRQTAKQIATRPAPCCTSHTQTRSNSAISRFYCNCVTMGKNIIFSIIWLLLLLFIAWPIAGFCAGIWIFLQVSGMEARCVDQTRTQYRSRVLGGYWLRKLTHDRSLLFSTQPFEAIFQFVKQITAFLEKLITWPRDLGKAIMTCQESFPSPM